MKRRQSNCRRSRRCGRLTHKAKQAVREPYSHGGAYPPRNPGENFATYRPRALQNIRERHDLFEAIAFVDPDTVEAILLDRPSVLQTLHAGMTPLEYAMQVVAEGVEEEAEQDMVHVLDLLIQYGAEVDPAMKGRMRAILSQGEDVPIIHAWLDSM